MPASAVNPDALATVITTDLAAIALVTALGPEARGVAFEAGG